MKLKQAILWQPEGIQRWLVLSGGSVLLAAIGYVHALIGLAYEFHPFFIIPILVVSWLIGPRFGYALALLAGAEWFWADWILAGDALAANSLLFNTFVRLAIFFGGVWLVDVVRVVLMREHRLAREDGLTRLPNRREFLERGYRVFAQAQRQGAPFAVAFIDLDHFKETNDLHGHAVGDQLLKRVAVIMRNHVRATDIPGRMGGDEFALLLPNMKSEVVSDYLGRLRETLLEAMRAQGWPVTFSIGVVSYATAPHDFDAMLGRADQLMYEAKRSGRDCIVHQSD